MKSFEATGRTVEEAITAGLASSGLSIGEVSVEILEEGSKGLFGLFGSRDARVRLTRLEEEAVRGAHDVFKNSLTGEPARRDVPAPQAKPQEKPRQKEEEPVRRARPAREAQAETNRQPASGDPAAAEKKPARQRKPREKKENPVETAQASEKAVELNSAAPAIPAATPAPAVQADPGSPEGITQGFLQQLTNLMGLQVTVSVARDADGHVQAQMDGDPQGILIGRRGETLDALQYLTSLKVNRGREEYVRVTLDSEGYRKKREDALIRLANRMANRAKKTGRRVSMEPMNPYERRIFHSALQAFPGIATHSEGEEPNRHVIITPVKAEGDSSMASEG